MMDADTKTVLRWVADRLVNDPQDDHCNRCGHSGHFHRLDDTKNLGPTHPHAEFPCIFPAPDGPLVKLCDCPDYIEDHRRGDVAEPGALDPEVEFFVVEPGEMVECRAILIPLDALADAGVPLQDLADREASPRSKAIEAMAGDDYAFNLEQAETHLDRFLAWLADHTEGET